VIRIGVISDTHGLLRPEAVRHLAGVAHIIHAGDIGAEHVLEGCAGLRLSRPSGGMSTPAIARGTIGIRKLCISAGTIYTSCMI
jgi:Calcineurin-like phosphoesterase superfamily domain